ncbi:MAG: ABC transporter permease subunit [Clostridia bacterium]|nr:ABC transporter permease subunit [Clostridia bacterium]
MALKKTQPAALNPGNGKGGKTDQTAGKVNRVTLIVAVVLALVFIAATAVHIYASEQTKIFGFVEYGASLQNNRILVSDELDTVYLGTYQNNVLAFTREGDPVWASDIGAAIGAMQFDEQKQLLIVGSQNRNVYIYNALNGEILHTYPVNGKVRDMDYNPSNGQLLVAAEATATSSTICVLNIESGEELFSTKLKQPVQGAKYGRDYQSIFYGDSRGRVTQLDLTGEKIAGSKARTEVVALDVVHETGDVLVLDKLGNLFKFDESLNELYRLELEGEGKALGASDDGDWIAVGTREGDIYILDGSGKTHFRDRQNYDITQVYFGKDISYVVTLSPELFEFSTRKLDNINAMSKLKNGSLVALIVSGLALATALIVTFPRSRAAAKRFFRSIYRHRVAYLMLLPSIVLILIFNYYNVFQALYYAFTDWSLATRTMREINFIGFDNFIKIFNEGYFLLGVKNLLIMMVASFLKLLTVPLLLAELVFAMRTSSGESSKRRYWFRLMLVMPMVVPGVVSTLMWKNIYDPNIGALNTLLDTLHLSSWKRSWLGNPDTALGAIIFMGFPFVNSFAFLVYYGGLINIPADLFEAARVDGSTPVWNFFHIHLPLISPQLKMLIITTFISSVQDYGGVYLLTQGGPGTATYVPGLELYYAATKFGQYGYACAMGLLMFIVILIGSLFNLRMKTQELN